MQHLEIKERKATNLLALSDHELELLTDALLFRARKLKYLVSKEEVRKEFGTAFEHENSEVNCLLMQLAEIIGRKDDVEYRLKKFPWEKSNG